jgi:hypothetical protein
MPDLDLDALEAAAKAATPGEWRRTEPGVLSAWSVDLPSPHHTVSVPFAPFAFGEVVAASPKEDDTTFIAAASPDVVLALVAEVRRARIIEVAAEALVADQDGWHYASEVSRNRSKALRAALTRKAPSDDR